MRAIRTLSNVALARRILRELWKLQDAGGVSHGRSHENVLLEAALALFPEYHHVHVFSRGELLNEAAKRTRISVNRRIQRHFKELDKLTRRQ